ncbi:adhesin [Actinoplanes teichomyceticus]|uniref:Uncharacterized protein n=1 Tax=Actinoplanes teichomyceticus TaxID=1867 RepID=A0A561WC48_ACTTI|nr:adhesin [Actinoplanes teichomyceticus]TWG21446.1 hypothetical protein FHX34_103985 [Actinoplanes teichomyceticus]GIF16580.1 hypothetical protein Ate01nite_66120 [Actinoplanes teichomyceticus]
MSMAGEPPQRQGTALGPGHGDVAYRMQGLRPGPVETGLDSSVPAGTLLRLWLWAAVPALLVWAVFTFLALLVHAASEPSLFSDDTPADALFSAGSLLAVIVFWTVLLAARMDEPVTQWSTLLEDRWQGADSAYAAIFGTLRRRGIPVDATAVRVRSDLLAAELVNDRLLITERDYRIHVTVFPYGSGLFLGWTMSRSRRGAVLLGHFLKDLVGGILGRTGRVEELLRAERVRALREAVHAAVREGAEVAAQGVVVPLAQVFGQEVPVQDLRAHATPAGYGPGYGPPPGYGGQPGPGPQPGYGPGPQPGPAPGGPLPGVLAPGSAPPAPAPAGPGAAAPGVAPAAGHGPDAGPGGPGDAGRSG